MTNTDALGAIAYLSRSAHRLTALRFLSERPRSRAELCELTGVSSSTIRRTLGEFEDRMWIRKEGYQYEITELGDALAGSMVELLNRVQTIQQIKSVWQCLPEPIANAGIETWGELTITVAEPDYPYRPITRFQTLLRETKTVRFVRPEVALMELSFDALCEQVEAGVDITLIDRHNCHRYFLTTYPNRSRKLNETSNFTVLEHDALPDFGIGLLDNRVIISCYDQQSGTVPALIDTNAEELLEWAEGEYERIRTESWMFNPEDVAE